jgi:nitroreductase
MGVQSVSASATYLLLAFEIKGLAACWYCAPLFAKDIIKDTLNLPNSFIPMAFFTVGYSMNKSPKPKRKDLKDIIFRV